jgi:hypothetical protein
LTGSRISTRLRAEAPAACAAGTDVSTVKQRTGQALVADSSHLRREHIAERDVEVQAARQPVDVEAREAATDDLGHLSFIQR